MGFLPKGADILPPSDDRVFKLILTSPDAKPALMDLISAVIGRNVVNVEVRNNEIPPADTNEKAERLDVNCRLDDNTQVDLEMQASRIEEVQDGKFQNLIGKSIYYLCDLHSSQSSRGVARYDALAQTYQVTFCSYTVFPERDEFVNSFSMRHDRDNELLSDAIHVVYVELSKLQQTAQKSVHEMTDLEKWSIFFQYANNPTYRDRVNEVIASKEELQMAGELLMSISQDERERAIFRSRRMYQTDMASNLATAEARGEAKGEAKSRLEIVRKMIKAGSSVDFISDVTGLDRAEIEKLIPKE